MDVVSEPLHLAHIRAKGPEHISAAAVSPDGQLIAFAGAAAGSLRLYRLSRMEVRPSARIPPILACMARIKALAPKHISLAAILPEGWQAALSGAAVGSLYLHGLAGSSLTGSTQVSCIELALTVRCCGLVGVLWQAAVTSRVQIAVRIVRQKLCAELRAACS